MVELMKLMSRSGAIRNCRPMDGQSLLTSGEWIDITKRGKPNENRNKESKNESEYKSNQWESGRICSSDMPTKIAGESKFAQNGATKKRGRPKKEILNDTAHNNKIRVFRDASDTQND